MTALAGGTIANCSSDWCASELIVDAQLQGSRGLFQGHKLIVGPEFLGATCRSHSARGRPAENATTASAITTDHVTSSTPGSFREADAAGMVAWEFYKPQREQSAPARHEPSPQHTGTCRVMNLQEERPDHAIGRFRGGLTMKVHRL